MQGRTLAALCAGVVASGCTSPAQLSTSPPPAVEQTLAVDPADIVTVEIVSLAASQPDVVCRELTRPGSRIVVGQDCRPRSQAGVTAEALQQLDRELRGRGRTQGDAPEALGAY